MNQLQQPTSDIHSGDPQPDQPMPATEPPGVPTPSEKPEVGPVGEPPGVPSPMPSPQRDSDLPRTIDPLGQSA